MPVNIDARTAQIAVSAFTRQLHGLWSAVGSFVRPAFACPHADRSSLAGAA